MSFASCNLPTTPLSSDSTSWILQSSGSCLQTIDLGKGSDSWTQRSVGLHITSLPAPLIVSILAGCTTNGSGCTSTYNSSNAGLDVRLSLSSVSSASLQIQYGTAANVPLPTSNVQIYPATSGSVLLLALTCVLCAGICNAIITVSWLTYQLWRTRHSAKRFQQRIRYSNPWFQLVFSFGGWCIMVGLVWVIIVTLSSSPTIEPAALLIAGIILAVVGFIICSASLAWADRDPQQFVCFACNKPVSRWHFVGTYIPAPEGTKQKAHSKHIRCVMCGEKVITECWPECPKHRRYHTACWDKHCTAAVEDPAYVRRWMAGAAQGGHVTRTELAHLLAAAVRHSAGRTITELMDLSPGLPSAPVSQDGDRTCMHIAARAGNLPILLLLLQSKPECLDPVCPIDPDTWPSLSLKGLDDGNDVYIHQPFVTLNDRALYVGHAQGKYLFYYEPANDESSKVRHPPGWCVTPYLGTGTSAYRLPLPDTLQDDSITTRQNQQQGRVAMLAERLYGAQSPLLKIPSFLSFGRRPTNYESPTPSPRVIGQQQTVQVVRRAVPTPSPVDLEKKVPKPNATKERQAEEIGAEVIEIHVEWLGDTRCLLEDAIASGDSQTIRYVTQLYKAQDPGCMLWYHLSGHGLWDIYPPSAQAEIRRALEKQQTSVTLESHRARDGAPVTLDLVEMTDTTTTRPPRPIRSIMRASFQHRESPDQPFSVTSDVESILNWNNTIVVFTPGHLAMSSPDEATLDLLVAEGIADFAAWSPPCKVGTREPEITSTELKDMFYAVFHKEIALVMRLGHTQFSIQATMGLRRAARVDGNSTTGIGSRLTDGLDNRQSDQTVSFYPPGYVGVKGCLPFCAELPSNPLGHTFTLPPLVKMAADSLMKLMEMQRQGFGWKARHIVAAYVYTYELQYDDSETGCQIYEEMNKAMRQRNEQHIEFWRPLIWEIDVALASFPPYKGKAYRGINCAIRPVEYQVGARICWTSFSSASQDRSVAAEFAEGESGTLFFLTSVNAKPISAISRFPEEAEVLFPPNTVFEITSNLLGNSEIGSFYGRVDNIAMTETTGLIAPLQLAGIAPPRIPVVGHTSFLMHVPTELCPRILDLLSNSGIKVLESVECDQREDGYALELLAVTQSVTTSSREDVSPQSTVLCTDRSLPSFSV